MDVNVMYYNRKIRLNNLKLQELSSIEMVNTQGGVLGAISVIAGVLYIAGEIAESAGRAYRKSYLK